MRFANRVFDIVLALASLPIAVPIVLVSGLLVRLTSGGPVVFAQERVGYKQSVFTCFKLRTMRLGTANGLSHQVGAAHITPLGHWLRRLKIDELPQLWNVLNGDMRFVGPRPGLASDGKLIDARQALGVFDVHPGITGLAQINGVDMSDPVRLAEWDRRYIDRASLSVDVMLIFRTAFGGGRGDATVTK